MPNGYGRSNACIWRTHGRYQREVAFINWGKHELYRMARREYFAVMEQEQALMITTLSINLLFLWMRTSVFVASMMQGIGYDRLIDDIQIL